MKDFDGFSFCMGMLATIFLYAMFSFLSAYFNTIAESSFEKKITIECKVTDETRDNVFKELSKVVEDYGCSIISVENPFYNNRGYEKIVVFGHKKIKKQEDK